MVSFFKISIPEWGSPWMLEYVDSPIGKHAQMWVTLIFDKMYNCRMGKEQGRVLPHTSAEDENKRREDEGEGNPLCLPPYASSVAPLASATLLAKKRRLSGCLFHGKGC